jgi:hypothetical protein
MNVVLVLLDLVLALAVGILELPQLDLPLQKLLPIPVNGDQQNLFHPRHDQMEVHPFETSVDMLDTPPPVSPSLGGSPALQRRKLALLPRSEHPQEPAPTHLSPSDEIKPKSNPFGAARPVDTDSALKKVEEKLAKEKEHIKEEKESSKTTTAANPSPVSPTGPRGDKSKPHPKQLLRRTSAKDAPAAAAAAGAKGSEIDEVVAAKAEAQDEAISEEVESKWRKVDAPVVATAPEEEAGWETVPARTKKANGVGARH